jgi:hypothetical protein
MSENAESINRSCPPEQGTSPQVRQVAQILKSLAKLIGGKKIYADNNPRLAGFRQEFHDKLRAYFEDETELVLSIEQTAIKCSDEIVYQNDKMEDSLSFLLYRDGVGEVTFDKGIDPAEIDRFVDVLTQEFHNREEDEDIVTKFWKADFHSITYRVLEDYLSSEFGDGADVRKMWDTRESGLDFIDHEEHLPSLEDKGRVIVKATDPIDTIDAYFAGLVKRTSPSQDPAALEETFQNILEATLKVNENELMMGGEELHVEAGSDPLVAFMESILSFTLLSQNPSAVRDVLNVCNRLIEFVVEEGWIKAVMGMYSLIGDFLNEPNLPDNIRSAGREYMDDLSSDALLLKLAANVEHWNKKSVETLEFFSMVGQKSLPQLCGLLRRIKGQKVHQAVCDAIVSISGHDVAGTLDFLDIDSPDIACDMVYLIRKAGLTAITPRVRELIHYPDVRVKTEVIRYLKESGSESALPLLLKALDDPDKTIRIKCLEALENTGDADVRRKLGELAFGKDLADRDMDEQEAIFKVLGTIGNDETVALIQNMLGKRRLLQFGKSRENKFLAIRALENICTSKSLEVLEELAGDSNNLVQSRAGRARDALRRRLLVSTGEPGGGVDRHD